MENEQTTLENENKETRPHYRYICSNTAVGFLNLLNENYEDGYKLFGEIELGETIVDMDTKEKSQMRQAFLYNTDDTGLNTDEKNKRMDIIDALGEAEHYAYQKKSLLQDQESFLLMNIKWDELNETQKEKGLIKISNDKLRHAYMKDTDKQYAVLIEESQLADEWLTRVKKSAELRELPRGTAPWIVDEKKAMAKEEKQEMPEAEKVQDIPEDQRPNWHPDDLKAQEEAK